MNGSFPPRTELDSSPEPPLGSGSRPDGPRLRAVVRAVAPFSAGVLAALLGLLLFNILFPAPHQLSAAEMNDSIAHAMASATPPPAFSERVYQIIQPSLVLIQTKLQDTAGKAESGLGSGVIIDERGDIMTSLHVVADAGEIKVTFADGSEASAQVAIRQPENDIAVLRPDKLPAQVVPAVLGGLGNMRVGDEVYAVGNPFGLYSSLSAGVISGFGRTFNPASGATQELHGLIQIDAAVNPGNSGGPLLNRDGQVIGIVTGLVNPTDQNFFIGIGFAVPIQSALSAFGGTPLD